MNFQVLKLHANAAANGYRFPIRQSNLVGLLKKNQKISVGNRKGYMVHTIKKFCLDKQL